MLRFDIPQVWSNVARLEALITTLVCLAALAWTPWCLALLVAQGAVRGFLGHHRCPSHGVWRALLLALGHPGKREDAGPKMFANKVLVLASSVALIAYATGGAYWFVPVCALLVFSTAEWAFSACAACWAYGAWYRRFPPAA